MFKLHQCVYFSFPYPEFPYDKFRDIEHISGVDKSFIVDIKYIDNQCLYGVRTSSYLLNHFKENNIFNLKDYLTIPFESWIERNFLYGPIIVIRDTIIYVNEKDLISAEWYGVPVQYLAENKFKSGDLVPLRQSSAGGICIMNSSHERIFEEDQVQLGEALAIIVKITDSKNLSLIGQINKKHFKRELPLKLNIKSKYNSWLYTYAESQDIIRRLDNINYLNCSNCLDYDKLISSGQIKT